jgi:hypothetical protein
LFAKCGYETKDFKVGRADISSIVGKALANSGFIEGIETYVHSKDSTKKITLIYATMKWSAINQSKDFVPTRIYGNVSFHGTSFVYNVRRWSDLDILVLNNIIIGDPIKDMDDATMKYIQKWIDRGFEIYGSTTKRDFEERQLPNGIPCAYDTYKTLCKEARTFKPGEKPYVNPSDKVMVEFEGRIREMFEKDLERFYQETKRYLLDKIREAPTVAKNTGKTPHKVSNRDQIMNPELRYAGRYYHFGDIMRYAINDDRAHEFKDSSGKPIALLNPFQEFGVIPVYSRLRAEFEAQGWKVEMKCLGTNKVTKMDFHSGMTHMEPGTYYLTLSCFCDEVIDDDDY